MIAICGLALAIAVFEILAGASYARVRAVSNYIRKENQPRTSSIHRVCCPVLLNIGGKVPFPYPLKEVVYIP